MEEKYLNLVNSFKNLDIDDKKKEIIKNIGELLILLYKVNNSFDYDNKALPVINDYEDEDEYYDMLFTYIISLKEENAKVIEKIDL